MLSEDDINFAEMTSTILSVFYIVREGVEDEPSVMFLWQTQPIER